MHSTVNVQAIATSELYCYLEAQADAIAPEPKLCFKTAQRKARYHDNQRTKKSYAKRQAMLATQCFSTEEVKYWLKKMGIKLDLRLTSAWVAVWKELSVHIKLLRVSHTDQEPSPPRLLQRRAKDTFGHRQHGQTLTGYTDPLSIKVGDRIIWDYPPKMSYIEQWFPLKVFSIEGDQVQLELLSFKVKLTDCTKVA